MPFKPAVALGAFAFALACLAADKSGVSPNTISLPKGPGSIEGLGESFQPSLNTGTAKYAIGLKLPSGTAGNTPSLGLNYEGGGGNGALGYGWTVPLPYIQRRTDHGIPSYGQDVGFPHQDTFINEMKEELVPQTNGYYFSQDEGAFIRYQPVDGHWEGTQPNGTRLVFGLSEQARIQNGTNAQIFAWLLEKQIDTHGNTILYSYSSLPDELNQNQKYLAAIRYGPGPPPWNSYHFVSFEYEDRPDWFEDCRSGFVVRTGKRLKTIRIGSQSISLAGHLQGDFDGDGSPDYLDRAYQLDYLNYAGTNSHWSLLAKVTPIGADGISTLPSSTFGYAVSDPPDLLSAAGHAIGGTNEPTVVMDNALVDLVDLNGDGLPDILKTDENGGSQQGFINRGEIQTPSGPLLQWDSPVDVDPGGGAAWSYNLSSADTHLADMDGDGLADLVHKGILGDVIYFPNRGNVSWGQQQMMSTQDSAPPSPFGEADARTADLDFDKRMDIIQSVSSGVGYSYRIWFNLGNQTYSQAVTVDQDNGFSLADPTVQIADLNGDRVPDMARIQPAGVTVTAGLGYGRFASPIFMALPDYNLSDTQMSRSKLTDLNGDGLADLVIERAAPGECWYWLNLGNYSWSTRKVISGLPTTIGQNAVVRWADLNGNGTTDLVYADHDSNPRIQTIDLGELLATGAMPNVLTTISNGLGRVSLIEYKPSTTFAQADAAAGVPWTNHMPLVVTVVAGVTTLDSLGHSYLTLFQYHVGYYDPMEKQFRGFARVEQVDAGDDTAPTLVTRSYFDTGQEYEAMKGKLLRVTTLQEDGKVFTDAATTWTVPPIMLMVGTNGTNVSYAHPVSAVTQIEELGQGTPRTLEQEFTYDNYGNQTRLADYGIVENGDRSAFNDERVATTDYAINTNVWLLRLAARREVQDLAGTTISRMEYYYDDETFSGGNFGEVTLGNLTLTREWTAPAQPSAYIKSTRAKYDLYGNALVLLDPLAAATAGSVDLTQGHVRQVTYDNELHSYPIEEDIYVGGGHSPLVFQARYDLGFGTTTNSMDCNSNSTVYGYDPFGRLVQVVKPGDTSALPTTEYDYQLAVPFGTNGLVNFVETRSLDRAAGTAGATKRDYYLISRDFTDGLGRKLMTKEEAEPEPGSANPRVVVRDATIFNARQKPQRVLNAYFSLQSGSTLDEMLSFENIEAPSWKGRFHENGQLVDLELSAAHQTTKAYDATLRAIQTADPDGSIARTTYEPLVTRAYDENDTDTASPFFDTPMAHYQDGLGRLIRAEERSHMNDDGSVGSGIKVWTTTFAYDPNDQPTQITDSLGNLKTMQYDGLKRKLTVNDPDRGTISFSYDDASNLQSTRDAKNQQIVYTYDGANRILTEDYLDDSSSEFSYHRSPDVAWHYDQGLPSVENGDGTRATARNTRGMLAYVTDTSGEEHNSFDERGRIEWTIKRIPDPFLRNSNSVSPLVSYRTGFQYDSLDRVTATIYPDNDQIGYEYNSRGLLQRITGGPGGSVLTNLVYAPSAKKQQIDFGNGVRTTYGYDNRERLVSLLTFHIAQPAEQLLNFTYTFDRASNVRTIQDGRVASSLPSTDPRRNSQAFEYDDLYRLTQVQYNLPAASTNNGGQIEYRYDRIGNMLSQTSDMNQLERGLPIANLGAMTYGGTAGSSHRAGHNPGDPPGPHALSSIQPPAPNSQPRPYSYDANGNMTVIDGLNCTWDFKDRLVAVENSTMRAEYTYDYSGRRITRTVVSKPGAAATGHPPTRTATVYVNTGFEVREHDQATKYVFDKGMRIASITGSLSQNARLERFRLFTGWNLVSLGVTATNLVGQLLANSPAIDAIYQWDPLSGNFVTLSAGQTGSAGTILWLHSSANTTAGILGSYTEPGTTHLEPGDHYLAAPGLEAWSPGFPASSSAWAYDGLTALWQEQLAGDLEQVSDLPHVLQVGQPVFVRIASPVDVPPPDPTLLIRFYHEDHLGSSAVITDSAGNLVEENAFFPFGANRNAYTPRQAPEPYQFTQKEKDSETGLLYFGKRFYAPTIAKWLSTDPLEEKGGGFNPYAYVNENPLRFQDREGEEIYITRDKGHVITIHLTAVLVNDSPILAKRGYDMNKLASEIKQSIEQSFQGKITEGKKKTAWTVKTKVESLTVVDNWDQVQPGKKGPHVFHTVDQTYDGQAANARVGGMLITIGAPSILTKKPSELSAEELANPINKSYAKAYETPGTIGAHEFGHNGGLHHESDSDRENLMGENRWYDSAKITSSQLKTMVETIEGGKANNPADVTEAKSIKR